MELIRGMEHPSSEDRISLGCPAWRIEGPGKPNSSLPGHEGTLQENQGGDFWSHVGIGQGRMTLNRKRLRLDVEKRVYAQKVVRTETSCSEKLWMPHAGSVQGQV